MKLVAFLRAINVGGHNVKMGELRECFEGLGFERVETFIASGNVILESRSGNVGALQRRIEASLGESLGYDVAVFLRTPSDVSAIARYRPFPAAKMKTAKALNVAFLTEPLKADASKILMSLTSAIDEFHVNGAHVYWLCRKKQSESTFSNAVFEKKLGVRATFRGVNTVTKLAAKHFPDAGR